MEMWRVYNRVIFAMGLPIMVQDVIIWLDQGLGCLRVQASVAMVMT